MKLPGKPVRRRPSPSQAIGLAMAVVGIILLILAVRAQSIIDEVGATNDPVLQDRVSMYQDQRDALLVTSIGMIFLGLFAFAILSEPNMASLVPQTEMISAAGMAKDAVLGLSLKGNACYLPAKNGLTRERVFVRATNGTTIPKLPSALSDELVASPGHDGSVPGMLLEPLGLSLLNQVETELGTKLEGSELEAVEGTLQVLKHGIGMIKDFHFKERDGKTIFRVEYGGLLDACRTVRASNPDTCRQQACIGCSCILTGAARATGKAVCVEEVENRSDTVVFTLSLRDW